MRRSLEPPVARSPSDNGNSTDLGTEQTHCLRSEGVGLLSQQQFLVIMAATKIVDC